METRHIWSTVTDDQVSLVALEQIQNGLSGLLGGDIAHDKGDSWDRSNLLEINRSYSDVFWIVSLFVSLVELLGQNLRPGSWCRAKINSSLNSLKDVEFLIDLDEFESRSSSKSLLLSPSIVGIVLAVDLSLEELLFIL